MKHNFFYIQPLKKLIVSNGSRIFKNQNTRIYDIDKQEVFFVSGRVEKINHDTCKSFVEANSVDFINSLSCLRGVIKKELFEEYERIKDDFEKRKKRLIEQIKHLSDEEFEEMFNRYTFYLNIEEFELNQYAKKLKYLQFYNASEEELIEKIRKVYMEYIIEHNFLFSLPEDLLNDLLSDMKSMKIELTFSKEDRKELLDMIYLEIEKQKEYFYSRPKRIEQMKKYNYSHSL